MINITVMKIPDCLHNQIIISSHIHTYTTRPVTRGLFRHSYIPHKTCHQGSLQTFIHTSQDMSAGVSSDIHTYLTRHVSRDLFRHSYIPHKTCHQGSRHSSQVQNEFTATHRIIHSHDRMELTSISNYSSK